MRASVLVTGASGFIGEPVARALLERGHRVRVLVHRREPCVPGVELASGDLTRADSLRTAVAGMDAIVHAAAALDPVESAEQADAVNRRGSVALARAALAAGAHKLVFLSSIAAIGFPAEGGLMKPDRPCAPTTPYGRSKRDAELALLALPPELAVAIVRPATVYGPGERRNFLALTRAVASGRVFLPGAANNRMSFCYLSNLVDAVARLVEGDDTRGIVHVADDPTPTFEQAVTTIARALGRSPPRLRLPIPVAAGLAAVSELAFGAAGPLSRARLRTLTADAALDVSSARALGIVPRVSFEEGVRRTVAWYQSERLLGSR